MKHTASVIMLNQAPGCQAVPAYLHSSVLTAIGPKHTCTERPVLPELWLSGNCDESKVCDSVCLFWLRGWNWSHCVTNKQSKKKILNCQSLQMVSALKKSSHHRIVVFTGLNLKEPCELAHFRKLCNWYVSMVRVNDMAHNCQQADLLFSHNAWLTWDVPCALCLFIYLFVLLICVEFRNFQSGSLGFPQGRHRGLFIFNALCHMQKTWSCMSWSRRNKYEANQFVLAVWWNDDVLAR